MIEFLINNWPFLIVAIAIVVVGGYAIYTFIKKPTSEQLQKVKEWLLFAVTKAEKELGGGTGQIKLRYVYDMFLTKFPYLAQVIPFEMFSTLVDEVLDQFENMLTKNDSLQNYVNPIIEE